MVHPASLATARIDVPASPSRAMIRKAASTTWSLRSCLSATLGMRRFLAYLLICYKSLVDTDQADPIGRPRGRNSGGNSMGLRRPHGDSKRRGSSMRAVTANRGFSCEALCTRSPTSRSRRMRARRPTTFAVGVRLRRISPFRHPWYRRTGTGRFRDLIQGHNQLTECIIFDTFLL